MKKKVNMKKIAEGLKNESKTLKKEVQNKSLGYILAGFGVVTGLAWNDAIKALITYFFPLESKNSILAQFGYAILMTLLIVIVSVYLSKLFGEKEEDKK
jgi:hypothetical protein